MKYDELAYVNQQLAGMLKSGVPLEGALKQLCATMQRGKLRTEFDQLEADLAQGTPLDQALARRSLPEFYVAMLRVGLRSNDLPGILTLLADYYQKVNTVWTRLKGLMVYPAIVVVATLLLSVLFALIFSGLLSDSTGMSSLLGQMGSGRPSALSPAGIMIQVWGPVLVIALLAAAVFSALLVPKLRGVLRWRLPGFREASLSQFASSLALLLNQGCHLKEALGLLQQLEAGKPAGAELARWQQRLAEGKPRFTDLAAGGRIFPPLFVWLVASSGEDWVSGLRRAAEVYYARAVYRVELMLYAALPVSVLVLGLLIVCQVAPVLQAFINVMNLFSDVGEM